mgnify:CR=1 FL=1
MLKHSPGEINFNKSTGNWKTAQNTKRQRRNTIVMNMPEEIRDDSNYRKINRDFNHKRSIFPKESIQTRGKRTSIIN